MLRLINVAFGTAFIFHTSVDSPSQQKKIDLLMAEKAHTHFACKKNHFFSAKLETSASRFYFGQMHNDFRHS